MAIPTPRLIQSGVILAAVSTLLAGLPASAQVGTPTGIVGDRPAAGTVLTLITGDKALVSRNADGKASASLIPSADDLPSGFTTRNVDGDVYVYPDSAIPALSAGRLDPELFNVTAQVKAGYDDTNRKNIPLIVNYTNGIAPRAVVPGVTVVDSLKSIGGASLEASKEDAGDFWDAFNAGGSIAKIWLDQPVVGFLERSVAQIGAPQAWAQGFDGTGAKVAVLDTGYDPNHPDLTGTLIEAKNFTSEKDPFDRAGHGTHVASTVLGNGQASGGMRKGVAPGAKLLVGRVLGSNGSGQASWIIAGMEWAVAQGADVINMSLGSSESSPGCDDPMGQAAERLAAQNTSLFVISAGNRYSRETIGSPGCAEGVLTVGAVDRELATADFSSRGPVTGDHRLKPEIAAPGVDIMAASMGSVGGIAYQPMSGTSMAAPHVAGVAAILAAKRPDWTAQQLRAALVSAVRPGASGNVYEQGAGVVDVPRAIAQQVFGPASADLGSFAYPQRSQAAVTREVAYQNMGDVEVALDLKLSDLEGQGGRNVPGGLVNLETQRLVVPAHGTATARIRINPRVPVADGAHGEIGGRIVATSGQTTVTTPFGFWFEPEMVNLTIKVLDRDGVAASANSFVDVVNMDIAAGQRQYVNGAAQITMQVRTGLYSIGSMISTKDAGALGQMKSIAFAGRPELRLTRDTTVTLDARAGVRHRLFGNNKPLEISSGVVSYARIWDGKYIAGSMGGSEYVDEYYAVPTLPVIRGEFILDTMMRAGAPVLAMSVSGTAVPAETVMNAPRLNGSGKTELVDLGTGTTAEIIARFPQAAGKMALIRVAKIGDVTPLMDKAKGSGIVALVFDQDVAGRIRAGTLFPRDWTVPGVLLTREAGDQLRAAAPVQIDWQGTAVSPYLYNLAFTDERMVLPIQWHLVADSGLASVDEQWFAQRQAGTFYEAMDVLRPHGWVHFPLYESVYAPMRRTTYYSPGVAWRQIGQSAVPFTETMADMPRTYKAGQHGSVSWYKQPVPTGIATNTLTGAQTHVGERQANLMGAFFPHYRDAYGHFMLSSGFGDLGGVELFRDGQSLGQSGFTGGQWVTTAEAADYELRVYTAKFNAGTRQSPNWRMSTDTLTSFRFRSQRPSNDDAVAVLPLVIPSYDMELDEFNLAPASAGFRIAVTGKGQADYNAGRIVSTLVWTSLDDGVTWTEAPVVDGVATVDNTAAAGKYVSLKVELTDEHGAAVTQTITKAYGVR